MVPGPVATHRLPDVTHLLRHLPGRPSVGACKREVRQPVDPCVLDHVVTGFAEHTA